MTIPNSLTSQETWGSLYTVGNHKGCLKQRPHYGLHNQQAGVTQGTTLVAVLAYTVCLAALDLAINPQHMD